MIRKFVIVLGVFAVLLILVLIVPIFFLNSIVKGGVEAVGPKIAKVDVKLESVNVSIFSGTGRIQGLFVGNPAGYKTPSAIKAGSVNLDIEPRSVFKDKLVVKSVQVNAPEITFEGGLGGNNLKQILDNVQAAAGSSTLASKDSSGGKRIQVDDFQITGGKVNLSTGILGGQAIALPLPDIHLTDLGKDSDGITSAELGARVMNEVISKVAPLVGDALGKVGQQALGTATDVGKGAVGEAGKAVKTIGDLFKKGK